METSKPVNKPVSSQTRRRFLGTATALTAASYQRVMGANDRLGVGLIGFGLIGKQHLGDFKKMTDVDVVGVCEAYKPRLDEAQTYSGNSRTQGYSDFRKMYENKDINGVIVATPDHWHALLTIMACAAGKDVYVEKPMTLFNDEGKWMIQAARKYNRVVVAGTQRRQGKGVLAAKKAAESGLIGKIHSVHIEACRNVWPGFGVTPIADPPDGMDYDMWLGPAQAKPYRNHRSIYHFRWFRDYSGGQMTNLGAHTIDQVLWIMNATGPTLAMCGGGRYVMEDDGDTPDVQDAVWQFAGPNNKWNLSMTVREANAGRGLGGRSGALYFGTKGTMVQAGSYEIIPEMKIDPVNDIPRFLGHPVGGPVYTDTKPAPWIPASKGGVASDPRYGTGGEDTMMMNERDWVDCMRSRKRPLCDVSDGHRVALVCNLANMSMDLGRAIRWDPEREVVIGDEEAQALCRKPYREPWETVLRSLVTV